MSVDELREIAAEVCALRPDWGIGQVLTALHQQLHRGTLAELRAAALRAADNDKARSPAAIGWESSWVKPAPSGDAAVKEVVPLPECAECGQPRKRARWVGPGDRDFEPIPAPAFCPGCGARWVDAQYVREDPEAAQRCACGAPARFGFAFCARCGRPTPAKLTVVRDPAPPPERESLAEPMSLGDCLGELPLDEPEDQAEGEAS